ncbi:replication factor RFC1 C terminal domain-containing protein [Talaromyces proteolyticus]|uniref:Replication factor C subunit 1 n=1 Tax=Talaromyces proteolyticus TaxID=1131652 RepID=A0AAD4Q6H6_9EURO|nr:replication factor RFC1 C terminal domain-containing protein [Talaromyces proteolyticus]KAH8705716.1 replication factor RFC1 C terminal domain-containing protein [Talaromyces proteolyticus]
MTNILTSNYSGPRRRTKESQQPPQNTSHRAKREVGFQKLPVQKTQKTKDLPSSAKKSEAGRRSKAPVRIVEDDGDLGGDDIFATDFAKSRRADDDYVEEHDGSDSDDIIVKPATAKKGRLEVEVEEQDDDIEMLTTPPPKTKSGRKRKSDAVFDLDEVDDEKPKKKPASKKQKATPKKDQPESKEIQNIFDNIPTKPKFYMNTVRSRTPPGAGSVQLPVGADNCLAGLSFVFTGVLDTLGREEGQSLVKKYGGKVTGAPSSKTSYVVLGSDAGPSKLKKIRDMNIKTINEEGLFELIRRLPANGGSGKAAEQAQAKRDAEEKKIRALAAEMDELEKKKVETKPVPMPNSQASSTSQTTVPKSQVDDRLWTTKYAPTSMNMICGNKGQVEKLQTWLRNWRANAKKNFKMPGKDGSGLYRAVMIHGPPGIGKTTAAHVVANLEGYDVVETNASDTRSKKLVEGGLLGVLDTTSLQGYFSGEGKTVESQKRNLVLIMDEVDGMSAGDRGGVGALAAAAKKTNVPLILICNERSLPKMKPFDHVTYELGFRRPTPDMIRARLSTICFREGMKIPPQVLDSLIAGTGSDIRQVINMLSTVKLDQKSLDYDKGVELSKAWEKHVILKPWDIVSKILNAQMFSPTSQSTLNDKIELYFNDHEFSYLMLQENYLKTSPMLANNYSGKERQLKLLELADDAASSISDGDLVDKMIHGSQQQWSLMPTHAAFSFVRPASYTFGNFGGRPTFTSWLGNNSKYGKLGRYVKEIQGHMRLRSTGDREEIRQQYMPVLWNKLVRPLMDEGKDSVEQVIDLMDSYFLTREDWDALVELGLGPMNEENVKIATQTKSAFTRIYNQRSHPLPFMKASNVLAPKKGPKVKPDIEDAIDESDEEEIVEDAKEVDEDEELDLKKDKYVKMPKAKGGAAKGNPGKGKKATGKGKKKDDDFIDGDEDEQPKKGRKGKGKAK